MRKLSWVLIPMLWLLPISVSRAEDQDKAPAEWKQYFEYDKTAPLDIERSVLEEEKDLKVYELTYTSPKGGRVDALLVVPTGDGPYPGIVFAHWGLGTYYEYLPEAKLYARLGAVSLLVDYPYEREGDSLHAHSGYVDAVNDRDVYAQAVIDIRRGIDLLQAEPNVDGARIACVGHSIGAQLVGVLSDVDRRLATVVICAGSPDLAAMMLEMPMFQGLRDALGMDKINEYIEVNRCLDAINHVRHAAPTPLLFQFARYEQYFKVDAMQRYADAASEPKLVKWYSTDHELNELQALLDRSDWLAEKLGFKPARTLLRSMIEK
jgi:dienelactone hydrolase